MKILVQKNNGGFEWSTEPNDSVGKCHKEKSTLPVSNGGVGGTYPTPSLNPKEMKYPRRQIAVVSNDRQTPIVVLEEPLPRIA